MIIKYLVIPLILITLNLNAQSRFDTLDGNGLKIGRLSFSSKKEDVLKNFGAPLKVFEPKYECGFLSESEQGNEYYSLQYKLFKFTGNTREGYILEEMLFSPKLPCKITFKGKIISHKTTTKQFESIFGIKVFGHQKTLYFKGADDALVFTFVNGFLSKLEYWSPC